MPKGVPRNGQRKRNNANSRRIAEKYLLGTVLVLEEVVSKNSGYRFRVRCTRCNRSRLLSQPTLRRISLTHGSCCQLCRSEVLIGGELYSTKRLMREFSIGRDTALGCLRAKALPTTDQMGPHEVEVVKGLLTPSGFHRVHQVRVKKVGRAWYHLIECLRCGHVRCITWYQAVKSQSCNKCHKDCVVTLEGHKLLLSTACAIFGLSRKRVTRLVRTRKVTLEEALFL